MYIAGWKCLEAPKFGHQITNFSFEKLKITSVGHIALYRFPDGSLRSETLSEGRGTPEPPPPGV